ncbi:MAG: helix-turn-helix transcriptional regulator [bacterium]|nr:helix-turn-helix transcriptional regulator [bacterium]
MNMNQRLEALRDDRDLLKKDVAKILGVVESVYSEWENNKLSIPTKRLYQLAELFEVNIDYIVGISDIKIVIKTNRGIDLKIVSARLKEIRKSLNLTMRDLADKFNTTSSAISNYENSKYLILSPFLIELCKFSNYSIDWVLGRTEQKYINEKK